MHCASAGMLPQTPDLKMLYCEIQRDLPGDDRPNQHCDNSFVKGLNVTDINLYVKGFNSRN